jgi:broad specificity phosphatase PhoE
MSEVEVVTDNYPILVAAAPLPILREQAERFRRYLADDSNTFDGSWLEEQQHRLDAVHSYIRNKRVRAEVSQCQRWIELRIGEWLGPASPNNAGRPDKNSSPGDEFKIHDRHKHEFRFMAEHKRLAADIMKSHQGREITRAALIAAIEDALLVNHGAVAGSICGADVRAVLAELIRSGL